MSNYPLWIYQIWELQCNHYWLPYRYRINLEFWLLWLLEKYSVHQRDVYLCIGCQIEVSALFQFGPRGFGPFSVRLRRFPPQYKIFSIFLIKCIRYRKGHILQLFLMLIVSVNTYIKSWWYITILVKVLKFWFIKSILIALALDIRYSKYCFRPVGNG